MGIEGAAVVDPRGGASCGVRIEQHHVNVFDLDAS
ncbi:hypothetical protein STPH1_4229 [Streptomyces sp. OM5714]|nr:hypothetical protein STPH1_4229 [Streptomyces sp. OM5714]